jgi:hypothetical protein
MAGDRPPNRIREHLSRRDITAWIERDDAGYVAGYVVDPELPPVTRHFRTSSAALIWLISQADSQHVTMRWRLRAHRPISR